MAERFGGDLAFLSAHTDALTLSSGDGRGQVVVVPAYQGRVMTSTANGMDGTSFGWINRDLIVSGKRLAHMNPYGGEDRFWLGPEGGQFALYFKPGNPFDFEHWQTPALIDTEPFDLVNKTNESVSFAKDARLTNYSGTEFTFHVERTIDLIDASRAAKLLGAGDLADVEMVGYESINTLTNTGGEAWRKESGLLSIWILGMFTPSPETTIVIPIVRGSEAALGPKVNDAYFGAVPPDRLRVEEDRIYFRGDGQQRGKIGVPPGRVKPVCGSYDAAGNTLTVVQFNNEPEATDYVNSIWAMQDAPYGGDVVNSYNDGSPETGAKPLGPFYELETSSPAAALVPGESIAHIHRTFHFQGDEAALGLIGVEMLGVSLAEIRTAFT